MISTLPKTNFNFSVTQILSSADAFKLDQSTILSFGEELNIATVSSNPLPNDKFFDSSKLREFVHDNFNFDENERKFSKWVENTVGIGEIARYEQCLLFPQCFQKTFTADM